MKEALKALFNRDLNRFKREIENSIKNSARNLCLHTHLNYHLGQINYHRRILDEIEIIA